MTRAQEPAELRPGLPPVELRRVWRTWNTSEEQTISFTADGMAWAWGDCKQADAHRFDLDRASISRYSYAPHGTTWAAVEALVSPPPRRIALVIARPGSAYPTTDTHCCGCPSLEQDELGSSCRVASIFGWESNITSRRLDAARRLPECRAAEVRS